jgi:hypothetical protein
LQTSPRSLDADDDGNILTATRPTNAETDNLFAIRARRSACLTISDQVRGCTPLCGFKQQRALVQLELADAFTAVGCLYVESTSHVNELGGSAVGRPREDPQRNGDAEAVIPQRRKRADAVDAGSRKRLACERKGHSVPQTAKSRADLSVGRACRWRPVVANDELGIACTRWMGTTRVTATVLG